MIEFGRDAHVDAQIEMADPDAVDTVERRDGLDILDAPSRFDLGEKISSRGWRA